jgi:pyridoxal phosphate enzyme (YggS family)
MGIAENIIEIASELPAGTRLIAVSKTKSADDIMKAYQAGQRNFGENKVQELIQKYESLPKDILWHMIGHLQSNKVKYIVPFVEMIHAVNSLKLLQVINSEALKAKRVIKILLQIYIASEETKFGLSCHEAEQIIASGELKHLSNIKLSGLMGMATFTDDRNLISGEFSKIKQCFDQLKEKYFSNDDNFCELSIGMSSDYKIAIQKGSTMVRIGSNIFGFR